jgi:putative ABC transport system ATP-binding protein
MTEKVLEANGISAHIPGDSSRVIFRDLDLQIESGESVAIIGRSGSGKSTLLSILGLLQPAGGGTLRVLGSETSHLSDARRSRMRNESIGFVFQDYALVRELDVRGNLEMPLSYGRFTPPAHRRARVVENLSLVGMSGTERIRPARLSGGEQQRIAIARALISSPRIILADEPTGALDAKTGDEIIKLLKHATAGTGCGLVVVTHDPIVAKAMDRIVRLDETGLHRTRSVAVR